MARSSAPKTTDKTPSIRKGLFESGEQSVEAKRAISPEEHQRTADALVNTQAITGT